MIKPRVTSLRKLVKFLLRRISICHGNDIGKSRKRMRSVLMRTYMRSSTNILLICFSATQTAYNFILMAIITRFQLPTQQRLLVKLRIDALVIKYLPTVFDSTSNENKKLSNLWEAFWVNLCLSWRFVLLESSKILNFLVAQSHLIPLFLKPFFPN